MSGHSKWATTKHKKAAIDAKRGKLFARLIKNIEVAARTGGGDPAGNPTLYDAIQKAKKNSVPADNLDRAVKRGSGAEAGGANYETIMYEGYGPGGRHVDKRKHTHRNDGRGGGLIRGLVTYRVGGVSTARRVQLEGVRFSQVPSKVRMRAVAVGTPRATSPRSFSRAST